MTDKHPRFDDPEADDPRRLLSDAETVIAARAILTEIGEEFDRARKESRAGAWSLVQSKLMTNMGVLVPNACSLDSFFKLAIVIEEFLKTEQGSESLHPMEALANFLNSPTFTTKGPVQ